MATKRVLLLEVNPWQAQNLYQQIRDLKGEIERAHDLQTFSVETGVITQIGDLQKLLLRHRPQILHLCGHGSGAGGFVLQDAAQQPQPVSKAELANLFLLYDAELDAVVLQACYSEQQLEVIVEHVGYAIGMQPTIRDEAAHHFSQGFYRALGQGKSVELAYGWGCSAIPLMQPNEATDIKTKIMEVQSRRRHISHIAETLVQAPVSRFTMPSLYSQTASRKEVLFAKVEQLSPEELGSLAEALEYEDALKQYRDTVRDSLTNLKLNQPRKASLPQLQKDLGLSNTEVEKIWADEQAPSKRAKQLYEEKLVDLVKAGDYFFDGPIPTELQQLQEHLNLSFGEVFRIEELVFTRWGFEKKGIQTLTKAVSSKAKSSQKIRPELEDFEFEARWVIPTGEHIEMKRKRCISKQFVEDLGHGVRLEMVHIPGGEFWMGNPAEESSYLSELSKPRHLVTVADFFLGKFVVTQEQYKAVMGVNPSRYPFRSYDPPRPWHPVEQVTWSNAVEFCVRLTQKTGWLYRLPSEAEWEYASRGGTATALQHGETIKSSKPPNGYLPETALEAQQKQEKEWDSHTVLRNHPTEVNRFFPNAFGIYNLYGNVEEWCADQWHKNYNGAPKDGTARMSIGKQSITHAKRGSFCSWWERPLHLGNWHRFSTKRRSGEHWARSASTGFRVVCIIPKNS